jgi:hypothetical protein
MAERDFFGWEGPESGCSGFGWGQALFAAERDHS